LWGLWRRKGDAADVEVFLEAIGLKEVGEFQGTDVPATVADFALEVADDGLDVRLGEAGPEEFEPQALAIKTQAHALAGQLTVQRVSLLNALNHEP
jgi:hypothetical protein